MAFTVVPTKVTLDTWTEAMWDTSLRDNLNKGVIRTLGHTRIANSTTFGAGFADIPPDHAHLMLEMSARDVGTPLAASRRWRLNFNADSGFNYDWEKMEAFGSTLQCQEVFAGTADIGWAPGGSAPANLFSRFEIWIPNYAGTIAQKCYYSSNSHTEAMGSAGVTTLNEIAGFWRNTSPITTVTIQYAGPIAQFSEFTLYGIGYV